MKRIAIVGGGASGLMASIFAKTKDNEVVLFEQNTQMGKKLLLTGNGKCNFWNKDQSISHYHSYEMKDVTPWITEDRKKEVMDFFQSLGIVWKEKNGYYYPFSNQSYSIRNALEEEAKRKGVKFQTDFAVSEIIKEKDSFVINPLKEHLEFEVLVLATGSLAHQKIDSFSGYSIAQSFGHSITPLFPSLVPLVLDSSLDACGVRSDVCVSIYDGEKLLHSEEGEIQITNYGVSGICIYNLSRYASIGIYRNKSMILEINFLPFLKEEPLPWFEKLAGHREISAVLDGILNYKLGNALLKECHIPLDKTWNELRESEKNSLMEHLTKYRKNIKETLGMAECQVCAGGISFKEVTNHFESKLVPNLYFTGELLDLDGDCGGYNLGIAWMSGMTVGKEISKK